MVSQSVKVERDEMAAKRDVFRPPGRRVGGGVTDPFAGGRGEKTLNLLVTAKLQS